MTSSQTKKTSLYIDDELLKKLKLLAIQDEKKVNEIIIALIEDYINKNN